MTTTIAPDGSLGPEVVLDPRACDCCATSAVTEEAETLIAYRDRSAEELRNIALVRSDGGAWTEPAAAHEDGWTLAGCPVNGPALSSLGARVALAWFTAPEASARVLVEWSRDGGRTFARPERADDGDPIGRAAVALLSRDEALVGWYERTKTGALFRVRIVTAEGRLGRSATVAEVDAGHVSGFPALVRLPDGDVLATWTSGGDAATMRVKTALIEVPAARL